MCYLAPAIELFGLHPLAEPWKSLWSAIPNTGKTTLFNRLTGTYQITGNWPGVSIEIKSSLLTLGEYEIQLVDLHGAHALSPLSEEELIVREYFLKTPPDVVLNILDARNLYRSLGLTLQMAMNGLPMVVAVNMMDEVRRVGAELDIPALGEHLGVPAVSISARTGEEIPTLLDALYQVIKKPERTRLPHLSFPPVLEEAIKIISRKIDRSGETQRLDRTFLSVRLLEETAPNAIHDQALIKSVWGFC